MTSISDASTNDDIASDIYSLTDQQLAANLEFMQEIGYGNWGSVWSCRSRVGTPAQTRRRLAVKLVHRTSSRTTPARVRSLWNEMKIVRSLKDNKHPAIIDFHSFIITPSYALITMEFLPRLVPVEVRESKAKIWFKSLLDGVAHLHVHGIVHNDIKPANILLTRAEQPVLVDFGFAEKYDLDEPILRPSRSVLASPSSSSSSLTPSVPKAPFESNLAYGTPEYLSPERAKGYIHDTRKSDVWSLGVTFFEIIIGRTPFELEEGEEFSSKEDLERYWHRTNNDIWVGTWKMSIGLERLLRAMLRPDADQRLNAPEVLNDPYFTVPSESELISAIRIDVQSKKVVQAPASMNIGSPASFVTAKTHFTMAPPTPTPALPRSKLGTFQNFIGKAPPLPIASPDPHSVQFDPMKKPNQQESKMPRNVSSLSKSFFSHSRPKSIVSPDTSRVFIGAGVTAASVSMKEDVNADQSGASTVRMSSTAITAKPRAAGPEKPPQLASPPSILKLEPIIRPEPEMAKPSINLPSAISPTMLSLRPLPGKENMAGPVLRPKPKSPVNANSSSVARTPAFAIGTTPTKSLLRVKNRKKEVNTPLWTRAPKTASLVTAVSPIKGSNPRLVHADPSTALAKQISPAPAQTQIRRPLSQVQNIKISESSKPKKLTQNGLRSLGHSVKKSIDKTAEKLSKMSTTAAGSLSRRSASKTLTTELQKSWDDLEKDSRFTGNLSAVLDESMDQSQISPPEPEQEADGERIDRMTRWIKDVEKVVQDTRQEFEREAEANETVVSRRSSSRLLTLQEIKRSTEVSLTSPSLPPPRRRNTVSSTASNVRRVLSNDHLKTSDLASLAKKRPSSPSTSLNSDVGGATSRLHKDDCTSTIPTISVLDTSIPRISDITGTSPSQERRDHRHSSSATPHTLKPGPAPQSSPPRPTSQADYDRYLLATQGIVKMGKGYSYNPDAATNCSPSTFYQMHHSSTEYIVRSDDKGQRRLSSIRGSKSFNLSKNRGHRRGGIFATLRGTEQDEAVKFAREYEATRTLSYLQSPYTGNHIETHPHPATARNKTFSVRMKKAFFRVVSSPMLSKSPIAVA